MRRAIRWRLVTECQLRLAYSAGNHKHDICSAPFCFRVSTRPQKSIQSHFFRRDRTTRGSLCKKR